MDKEKYNGEVKNMKEAVKELGIHIRSESNNKQMKRYKYILEENIHEFNKERLKSEDSSKENI